MPVLALLSRVEGVGIHLSSTRSLKRMRFQYLAEMRSWPAAKKLFGAARTDTFAETSHLPTTS